jgi:hypothetical protein
MVLVSTGTNGVVEDAERRHDGKRGVDQHYHPYDCDPLL